MRGICKDQKMHRVPGDLSRVPGDLSRVRAKCWESELLFRHKESEPNASNMEQRLSKPESAPYCFLKHDWFLNLSRRRIALMPLSNSLPLSHMKHAENAKSPSLSSI